MVSFEFIKTSDVRSALGVLRSADNHISPAVTFYWKTKVVPTLSVLRAELKKRSGSWLKGKFWKEAEGDRVERKDTPKDKHKEVAARRPTSLPALLPKWEMMLYGVVVVLMMAKMSHSVHRASVEFGKKTPRTFGRGISIFGGVVDRGNGEWEAWKSIFVVGWWLLLGHVLVARVFDVVKAARPLKRYVFTAYGTAALIHFVGIKSSFLIYGNIVAMFCLLYFTQSRTVLWTASLGLIYAFFSSYFMNLLPVICDMTEVTQPYVVFTIVTGLVHKNLAYCLEVLDRPRSSYSLYRLLEYHFYPPLMLAGPIITYDQFEKEIDAPHRPWTKNEVLYRLFRLAKIAAIVLLNEVVLHYLAFPSMYRDLDYLKTLDWWTLGGMHIWESAFFSTKYMVMFGLPSQVAQLDRMDAPESPSCSIGTVYYTDVWKKFDRGLHAFLKRYIYVPLGGGRCGMPRKLMATCASFFYVGFWHGHTTALIWWVGLNALEAIIEVYATMLFSSRPFRAIKSGMGPRNTRRVQALLSVLLVAFSAVAIQSFFNGLDVAWLYFDMFCLKSTALVKTVTFLGGMYTTVQFGLQSYHWEVSSQRRVARFLATDKPHQA